MIQAYYQMEGGHVYPILKDGLYSGIPIFSGVKRTEIEHLFDEIIQVRTVNDLPSKYVSSDGIYKDSEVRL